MVFSSWEFSGGGSFIIYRCFRGFTPVLWCCDGKVGGVLALVVLVKTVATTRTRAVILGLSDYHTVTLHGGGRVGTSGLGGSITAGLEGSTHAGCLPGMSTVNKCR